MRLVHMSFTFAALTLLLALQLRADDDTTFNLRLPILTPDDLPLTPTPRIINIPIEGVGRLELPDTTRRNLDRIVDGVLQRNPQFKSGIVDLENGQRLKIDRQGRQFVVSPAGGAVGRLPTNDTLPSDDAPNVLRMINERGEVVFSTGRASAVLSEQDSTPRCGSNTSDPNTHCALSTVRLLDKDIGLFCTGVVISDNHVLTAAHCLCDKDPMNIHVKFGAGALFHALPVSSDIAFYDNGMGTHCAAGQTSTISADNGDLAILTMVDPDPDDEQNPLDVVAQSIEQKAAEAGETLEDTEVRRLRALIGVASTTIWQPVPPVENGFATWGWGDGPDGIAGTKRGMIYPFSELMPCLGDMTDEQCDGLQEALFHDESYGLCAGDSGGGVFKAADPGADTAPESLAGYGHWALMGIGSGDIAPADCHSSNGQLLQTQHPRNITRIDTPGVVAWLNAVTDNSIRQSPVRMTYDITVADNR